MPHYYKGFLAVWRPLGSSYFWVTGQEAQEFKELDTAHFQSGLRLADVDFYDTLGTYTAIWRPGSGAQHWQAWLSAQDFKQQDDAQFQAGRRLAAIERSDDGVLGV